MTTTHPGHVTVFGATGGIGRHVVDQLLAAGHTVTAYVRNPAQLTATYANLQLVEGQLDDAAAVAAAVRGTDAVISALGPSWRRGATGTPVDRAPHHRRRHARRSSAPHIGLAPPEMADERDQPTIKGKVLRLMPRLAMPNAFRGIDAMGAAITPADLDWTIARITSPTTNQALLTDPWVMLRLVGRVGVGSGHRGRGGTGRSG